MSAPPARSVLPNNHSRFRSATFKSHGYCLAQALRFAVEEINNTTTLLPNVTLGYEIYDTCSESTNFHATLCALAHKGRQDVQVLPSFQHYEPQAVAVIGPDSTRLALTTAAVLSLFLVPEVSAASMADEKQGSQGVIVSGRVGSDLRSLVELEMQPLCVCCHGIFPRQSVGWLAIHHSFLLLQHVWHWVHCLPSFKSSQDRQPVPLALGGAAHPLFPGCHCRLATKPPRSC